MIVSFIDDMRAQGFAVESICRVLREQGLQIAARTYRSWKQQDRPVAERTVTDAMVVDAIREAAWKVKVDAQGNARRKLTPEGLYGRRKMTRYIRRTVLSEASWGAVDRAMRLLGLEGVTRLKKVRTTIPDEEGKRAKDLLDRDFSAPHPNHTWVMDFTYVSTWAGFVYVAFVLDVFSQMIVSWHAQTTMHTDLVLTPLRMALWSRDHQGNPVQPGQLRAHSDAGSQYTSIRYTERLELEEIAPSIGSVGDAFDNALMESINGLYKTECIRTTVFHSGPYKTISDVEFATAGWVDWYNTRRLHGTLGMVPPSEYEQAYHAAQTKELQPV